MCARRRTKTRRQDPIYVSSNQKREQQTAAAQITVTASPCTPRHRRANRAPRIRVRATCDGRHKRHDRGARRRDVRRQRRRRGLGVRERRGRLTVRPRRRPSCHALKTSSKGSFTTSRPAQMPTESRRSVGIKPVWSPNWYDHRGEL